MTLRLRLSAIVLAGCAAIRGSAAESSFSTLFTFDARYGRSGIPPATWAAGEDAAMSGIFSLKTVHSIDVPAGGVSEWASDVFALDTGGMWYDADGDGIPDWWTKRHFGQATGIDCTSDADNDGFSAYQEFVADTDPLDPASKLIMTIERCDSGFELSFKTAPDRVYELHHAESIDELISAPTVESIQGTGSTVTRQFEAGPDTLFFRVTVALPEND